MRLALWLGVLAVLAAILASWAVLEAREQQRETMRALEVEADLLARSLGPALAAANAAGRELDEQLTARLVDGGRLLGLLIDRRAVDRDVLERQRLEAGFDTVLVLDSRGRIEIEAGAELPDAALAWARAAARDGNDMSLFAWDADGAARHRAAAVTRAAGGAVVVSVDLTAAYSFARTIGVENLLQRVVETGSVLYLVYGDDPHRPAYSASWDGQAVPERSSNEHADLSIRGRAVHDVPIAVAGPAGHPGTLRVGLDASPLLASAAAARRRTLLVALVTLAAAVAGAAFAISTRVRARERAAAQRRLDEEVEARRRSERLAAAGALTAGLAHEVRSPLNAIALAAQRIGRRHAAEDECGAFAATIRDEVTRLDGVLKSFLDLARPSGAGRTEADLFALVADVAGLLRVEARERSIELDVDGNPTRAQVDADAVRRAVINLVRNAIEASPNGGRILVRAGYAGGRARILVSDDGPGVPQEIRERLFEPFVTGRAEGTGLGLALVRRIAEEHAGTIELRTRAEGGTDAVLELPAAAVEDTR